MNLQKTIEDFMWNSTLTLLVFLCFLSFFIYKTGKDKVFLFYALYLFFLMNYVLSRKIALYVSDSLFSYYAAFNWLIQIIYHNIHLLFGIYLLDVPTRFPKAFKRLKIYIKINLPLGILLGITTALHITSKNFYTNYFLYVHLFAFLIVTVWILQKAFKSKSTIVYCFFWGTLSYAVFAMIALTLTMLKCFGHLILPIVYFYVGITIEIIAFAIGLGFRIKKMNTEKLQFQTKLNEVQLDLQEKLEEKIKIQEKENALLLQLKENQELETKVALLQNKVLRSQMNSHFIFNVLNSIKTFIIENNEKKALNYLGKFAKFIRKVLDSNFYEVNTLEEELKTITLYLEIESVRLHHNFTYKFNIDPSINTSAIKFPALLLQPYIENAIWHGLMPQKGEKILLINIANQGHQIEISINDNGIGYTESQKNKSKSIDHKSFGISIVNERIKEFNRTNPETIVSSVIDKQQFGAMGTIAKICILKKH